jgi:T4 gene Gp59 loader of gp41 DNA helicase
MSDNTGFAAFALYNAMKLHFTSNSYDYFKYHGKTNVSKQSFSTNRNKYHFYKLSRKYTVHELRDFYLANFINGAGEWIGDITGPDGEENYRKWQKTNQALTYTFENDIIYLLDKVDGAEFWSFDDYFKPISGGWPNIITRLMKKELALESVCLLVEIANIMPMWEKEITDDLIWPTWHRLIKKYTPFIQYDKEKILHILKRKIREYDKA